MTRSILIVEDDWLIGEDLAEQLSAAGYHIIGPAPSVDDAFSLLSNNSIDLALLDIGLGYEKSFIIASALIDRRVPFVFLTGHQSPVMPSAFSSAPVLTKPIATKDLLRTLNTLAAHSAPGGSS